MTGYREKGRVTATGLAALAATVLAGLLLSANAFADQVVRQGPGYTVTRVETKNASPAAARGGQATYKVAFRGRYPVGDNRYELRAGGQLIAYAKPAANLKAVTALTTNRAVLSSPLTLTYGGRPARTVRNSAAKKNTTPAGYREGRTKLPNGVIRETYNLGDAAFQPAGISRSVEVVGDIHYPANFKGAPLPVVVFMHGNHVTCYQDGKRPNQPRVRYTWPCRNGFKPIPNYAGYGYLARHLAANGFAVISISANGVNVHGYQVEDTGMEQRGQLLSHHLDLWQSWSTDANAPGNPFGKRFVGKLDFDRIGTMGHSRGGEGVVWNQILNEEREHPHNIRGVLALAPVDFTRSHVSGVDFAVVLPTCDGDVDDLQGVHMYDDARYATPGDQASKHLLTVYGANHNAFNRVWQPGDGFGGDRDTTDHCPEPISPSKQRQVARDYIGGFFLATLKNDRKADRIWKGARRPKRIPAGLVNVSYTAPDNPTERLDIARFQNEDELGTNLVGGVVQSNWMRRFGWCAGEKPDPCVPGMASRDVHLPGLSQALFGWRDSLGRVSFDLGPESRDITRFRALQFRAMPNPAYRSNPRRKPLDFNVVLIDGDGRIAKVKASRVDNTALRPIRHGAIRDQVILGQVRFPLKRFDGVDLTDIRRVEFRFNPAPSGVLSVADLAFAR